MKEQNLLSVCLLRQGGVPITIGMKVETKERKEMSLEFNCPLSDCDLWDAWEFLEVEFYPINQINPISR